MKSNIHTRFLAGSSNTPDPACPNSPGPASEQAFMMPQSFLRLSTQNLPICRDSPFQQRLRAEMVLLV